MKKTLYEILEVSENASKEVMEKAYKVLAKKYHPDLQPQNKKADAEMKMKQINEAYETLIDDEKRIQYDKELSQKREQEKILDKQKYQSKINKDNDEPNSFYANPVHNQTTNDKYYNDSSKIDKKTKKQWKNEQRKIQEELNHIYQNAYENYLRSMGFRIKQKWTWKRARDLMITVGIMIFICVLLWVFPPTKKFLIEFYENNIVIKTIVDVIIVLFQALINAFISIFNGKL